jgi:hypothetical protein
VTRLLRLTKPVHAAHRCIRFRRGDVQRIVFGMHFLLTVGLHLIKEIKELSSLVRDELISREIERRRSLYIEC